MRDKLGSASIPFWISCTWWCGHWNSLVDSGLRANYVNSGMTVITKTQEQCAVHSNSGGEERDSITACAHVTVT